MTLDSYNDVNLCQACHAQTIVQKYWLVDQALQSRESSTSALRTISHRCARLAPLAERHSHIAQRYNLVQPSQQPTHI